MRTPLALLLAAALALRLAAAFALPVRQPTLDQGAYDEVARSLLAGRGFTTAGPALVSNGGEPTSLWGCLHPLYVASVYGAFGPRPFAVRLTNALLGLLPVGAAFVLARGVAGRRAGLVAGALVAADPYLIYFATTLFSETLYTALLTTALVALVHWIERPGAGAAAASGGVLGLAALTRGTGFYFALLAIAFVLLEVRRRPGVAREAAACLAALAATLAPWVARNRAVHDRPVFLDTKSGWNLYAYLHPTYDPWRDNEVPYPAVMFDRQASESRRNEVLVELGLGFLRTHPGHCLAMIPGKLWQMWSPLPGRQTDPGFAIAKTAFLLPFYALAVAGAWRAGFGLATIRLLHLLLLCYLLVHSVMVGSPRFRTPLDPALAVLAAIALVRPLSRVAPPSL
jgi:4-amino-4-deoxy-L-arabinose transferase-like glycosyltransferase